MSTTRQHHAWTPEPDTQPRGPSPAWVQRVAEWIAESEASEAVDIARDVAALSRRMTAAPPQEWGASGTWLLRLADWVATDPRPQADEIARQLREWAWTARVIRLPG